MTRRYIGWLLGFVVVAAFGCEKGPPPGAAIGTPSPTRGKVTFADGSPLKGGIVTFHPLEAEVGGKLRYEGAGLVDANGEFTAGLNGNGAGLVPGDYKVTVKPREIGELPGSNSSRIPKAFQEKGTTTLTAKIEASDNTCNLVLK